MQTRSAQLISILLLILIVLGGLFFVAPMKKDISALKEERTLLTTNLLNAEQEQEELSALSEKVSKNASNKKSLESAVPEGVAQDELILGLLSMSEKAGFNARVMSFSQKVDKNYGNIVSLSLSLTGNYSNLSTFLQLVESSERLFNVNSITAQRVGTSAVTFGVNLDAYYQ